MTPGQKSAALLAQELADLNLPNMKGKSVLDIGAWDGFYSFEAERHGASRVVALDYHAWHSDVKVLFDARRQDLAANPDNFTEPPNWHEDSLPGKRPFDIACDLRSSNVESVVADFTEITADTLGTYDVTLFLGVLYHLRDPLAALATLAQATLEVSVIETEAIVVPGFENASFCEFYETDELNHDSSNWWAPTEAALVGMCRAAGFKRVQVQRKPPHVGPRSKARQIAGKAAPVHYRAIVHAFK